MEKKWIAGNGQEVIIKHLTEKQNIADHTYMTKCDEIEITLNGDKKIYQGLVNLNGIIVIQVLGGKIRMPAEHVEEIKKLDTEIKNRRNARMEKSNKIEKEYINHKKAVENTMNK